MKFQRMTWIAMAMIAVSGSVALAMPPFLPVFQQTYPAKTGSALESAQCMTCHKPPAPPELDPYGKALKALLTKANTKTLTPDILHQLDAEDSDKDGWANEAEIKEGFLPGDPKSHPAGEPPVAEAPAEPAPTNAASVAGPSWKDSLLKTLFPLHSFHPIIVHFPIGLFIFGGLLEIFGVRRRRDDFRTAGFVNMVAGGAFVLFAIISGFTAMYRNGFGFTGTMRQHIIIALSAALGMGVTLLIARRDPKRNSTAYWVLIVVTILLIALAGHLGGEMVYG